jgi:hypothetical protein
MSNATPILMTAENPSGWKLEDLLAQLRKELLIKTEKITGDSSVISLKVQCNNLSILRHLHTAESLQRESYAVLATKAPDEGPTGQARIGATAHANT